MNWVLLLLGFLANLPVGIAAYRKQSLTVPGGLVTAGVLGYLLFIIQPTYWILLLVFFGSSSILTKFKATDLIKQEAMSLAEKGGERDLFQVAANGGVPLVLALIAFITEHSLPISDLTAWYSIGLATAFAVVNADTWATELGVTSRGRPYWILNPTKKVPRGTSGAISTRGLLASLLAALLVATIYLGVLLLLGQYLLQPVLLVIAGGLIGSLLDSVLGATVQAQYYCPICDKLTEQPYHDRCDTNTQYERGLTWFTNDLVNIVSVVVTVAIIVSLG